jgi:hypothetical protein
MYTFFSVLRIRDPGSGMKKFGSGMKKVGFGIRDKHPGSATLFFSSASQNDASK